MNQILNDLIKELGTKKQVKVEYLLPKLRKIKREIEPKYIDSFGNPIKIGDDITCSVFNKNMCIEYTKDTERRSTFEGMNGVAYLSCGVNWRYVLSVKAYKANPKKYNKILNSK